METKRAQKNCLRPHSCPPQRKVFHLQRKVFHLEPIVVSADNAGFVRSYNIDYHSGPRYAHLERNATQPDLLAQTLQPLAGKASGK